MIWNWEERSDSTYPKPIIEKQDVELVIENHFKYIGVGNNHNTFNTELRELDIE